MYGIIEQGSTGLPPSVPFEQPKNLFRYGEQTMWSTQLHAGAGGGNALANGTFRLFTTPLGQVGQGFTNALTIGETNLKEGGRIPAGIAYDVFGVACQIGACTGTGDPAGGATAGAGVPINGAVLGGGVALNSLNQILTNGVLSWDFTQTQVDISVVNLIGAGGGAFGSVSASDPTPNAQNAGAMNNGAGSVWLYRKHPVALPGNSTFSILLRYGNRMGALAGGQYSMFVKVVLLGYYKNVIEIG